MSDRFATRADIQIGWALGYIRGRYGNPAPSCPDPGRKRTSHVNRGFPLQARRSGGRHAGDEYRQVAEAGTILRCQVGSGVHGTSIRGQDDRDEMGICIEPPEYVIGLRRFEQYIYRSQPEGHRSGPGDLDLTIYSLRKWMRLALAGNPTILLPLFVPDDEIVTITAPGRSLREQRGLILSRQAGHRFAGYLEAQRRGLLSRQGKGRDVTRPELVEAYGWDVKYGAHMIRLGVQGTELLETGWITLPMPEPWRSWITDLRQGGHSMDEALSVAEDLERQLRDLTGSSPLPERPDYAAADRWLIKAYQSAWAGSDGKSGTENGQ